MEKIVKESRGLAELRFSPDPIVYTDEIYKATTKIVVGRDAVFTWRSAIFMKREDYRTVKQYVIPFRQAVQAANRLNAPISPFCASTLLLEELKKEFPSLTDSIEVRFFSRRYCRDHDRERIPQDLPCSTRQMQGS